MFTLNEIIKAVKGKADVGGKQAAITGISTDTRKIKKGNLFIALKGYNFDGHNFINTAIKKGASAVLVKNSYKTAIEIPAIKVKNTTQALAAIARHYRMSLKARLIAITGSNGKTTTKDMIAHILSKRYSVYKTKETQNNLIGVSLTTLGIKNEEFGIIEMGTNLPGEIAEDAFMVKPCIGLITNISASHLKGLKNKQNILKEKKAIFTYLDKNGIAIINNDDKLLSGLRIKKRKVTFGILNKQSDFYADIRKNKNFGIEFLVNKKYIFKIPILGEHNIYNALAAVSVCANLGISVSESAKALSEFKLPKMRLNKKQFRGITILNDAYNANPASTKAALTVLNSLDEKGKRIFVFSDMLELGTRSKKLHFDIGSFVAKSNIDYFMGIGKMASYAVKGARACGMGKNKVACFKDKSNAAESLMKIAKRGDVVLVKGSRSTKMEDFINCFTTFYTR